MLGSPPHAPCAKLDPAMKRKRLAACCLALLCLVLCPESYLLGQTTDARDATEATQRPPNIILIMADDIGYECFGAYGSEQYETPNIDRMAEQGVKFTHCYSQPLCTPSRVKLMTGVSNVEIYSAFSVLNPGLKTIGQYFQTAGYKTAVVGKWQLLGAENYAERFRGKGTWPKDAGFDRMCLWQVDKLGSRYDQPLLYTDGENIQHEDDTAFGPQIVNEFALKFMEENRERPFFLYYPMILVHNPFVPTPESPPRTGNRRANRQANFEDMVRYMDKMVGRVIDKTHELGIAENTLIVFCGDNGTNRNITSTFQGQPYQGGKGQTTDAGTRVPLVCLWPGTAPAGQVCEDLVDFSDFLPTSLQAAGEALPAGLDGRSFLPQLRGEAGNPREWLYCFYCPRPERTEPVAFARDKRWKLYADGRFYDLANDVAEAAPLPVSEEQELSAEARAAHAKLQGVLDSKPKVGRQLLKFDPPK